LFLYGLTASAHGQAKYETNAEADSDSGKRSQALSQPLPARADFEEAVKLRLGRIITIRQKTLR